MNFYLFERDFKNMTFNQRKKNYLCKKVFLINFFGNLCVLGIESLFKNY